MTRLLICNNCKEYVIRCRRQCDDYSQALAEQYDLPALERELKQMKRQVKSGGINK